MKFRENFISFHRVYCWIIACMTFPSNKKEKLYFYIILTMYIFLINKREIGIEEAKMWDNMCNVTELIR